MKPTINLRTLALTAVVALLALASCRRQSSTSTASAADSALWADSAKKLNEQVINYYNNNVHDSLVMFAPSALQYCREHGLWGRYYDIWKNLAEEYTWTGELDSAVAEVQSMPSRAAMNMDSLWPISCKASSMTRS